LLLLVVAYNPTQSELLNLLLLYTSPKDSSSPFQAGVKRLNSQKVAYSISKKLVLSMKKK